MKCDYCGKQRMVGNKISHSNVKTKRTQRANVQRIRAIVNGQPKRVYACTRCVRSGRVNKVA
ncbi:MAG: 50S ribosomal protein L28 [Myxococcota bacterium]